MSRPGRPSLVDQVRDGLMEDLLGGKLSSGVKLPNENALAGRFGVSRATVREAVQDLMNAGYLVRRHGSGTYVTFAPRTRHPLETTVSYTAMIREAGHEPHEKVLGQQARIATDVERDQLGLRDGALVVEVERVRCAGPRPVIYSLDRIPRSLLGEPTDARLDSSLYAILQAAGHPVARARAQLIPTVATMKLAAALGIKRGTPLLHVDQVDYDALGRAVMLSHEWLVADAFELVVNRRTPSGAAES